MWLLLNRSPPGLKNLNHLYPQISLLLQSKFDVDRDETCSFVIVDNSAKSTATMTSRCRLVCGLVLLSQVLVSVDAVGGNIEKLDGQNDEQLLTNVIDWARSNGAFIHENIEIRPIEGELSGIFAKEPIPAGTVVSEIPWSLILQAKEPSENEKEIYCDTVWTVYESITKPWEGDDSDDKVATPYEQYLSARTSRKYLPAFWSPGGRVLLKDMLGESMPTLGFDRMLAHWWYGRCGNHHRNGKFSNIRMDDDRVLDALYLVMTRGEGNDQAHLIPFHDLINHRNGPYFNTDPIVNEGKSYQLVTLRDIKKDEQLQNSYNRCKWCKIYSNPPNESAFIVTAQLFEQYGFVESYPQRWVIPEVRLLFDIEGDDDDITENVTKPVAAMEGRHVKFVVPPSIRSTNFMLWEIVRLENFQDKYTEDDRVSNFIPKHEMDAIWHLHQTILSAFALAYGTAVGQTSEEVWSLDEYWYWEGGEEEEVVEQDQLKAELREC